MENTKREDIIDEFFEFKCKICGDSFDTEVIAIEHYEKEHKE